MSSILEVQGWDSIEFVAQVVIELGCTLYDIDGGGLFRACDPEEAHSEIKKLGVSKEACHFASVYSNRRQEDADDDSSWNLRVTSADYQRIIDYAHAVADGRLLPGADLASASGTDYPPELSAAIDAFNAVRSDPNTLKGRSPRQALLDWIKKHRPEISSKARERIATMANWQPAGGAPKTPGQ